VTKAASVFTQTKGQGRKAHAVLEMGTRRGRILVWSFIEIQHNWRVKVLRIKEWRQMELRREASGVDWW